MCGAAEVSACGHGPYGEHDEPEGADGETSDREEPSGYEPL